MSKPILCTAAILLVATALAFQAGHGADEKKPALARAESDFRGKILAITLKADNKVGSVIQDASVKRIAGREFLVGLNPDDGMANPFVGSVMWLPLDEILMIVEFKSIEDAAKAYKEQAKQEK